jgi:hypothetical protein
MISLSKSGNEKSEKKIFYTERITLGASKPSVNFLENREMNDFLKEVSEGVYERGKYKIILTNASMSGHIQLYINGQANAILYNSESVHHVDITDYIFLYVIRFLDFSNVTLSDIQSISLKIDGTVNASITIVGEE